MTRLTVKQARELGIIPQAPKVARIQPVTKAKWDAKRIDGGVMLVIPENMPSFNQWKNWHWARQAQYKKELTEHIAALTLLVGRPMYQLARVEVVHYFRTRRRRDQDNQTPKFLLDALRYAGVIVEDHSEVLQLEPPRFELDRESWRTEVFIWQP